MIPNPTTLVMIPDRAFKCTGTATAKLAAEDFRPLEFVGLQYESPVPVDENGEVNFQIRLLEVSQGRKFRLAITIEFKNTGEKSFC